MRIVDALRAKNARASLGAGEERERVTHAVSTDEIDARGNDIGIVSGRRTLNGLIPFLRFSRPRASTAPNIFHCGSLLTPSALPLLPLYRRTGADYRALSGIVQEDYISAIIIFIRFFSGPRPDDEQNEYTERR